MVMSAALGMEAAPILASVAVKLDIFIIDKEFDLCQFKFENFEKVLFTITYSGMKKATQDSRPWKSIL